MAKNSDSVTEMDAQEEESSKKQRRGLFGRRKKDEVRSETEWTDTLRAADEEDEDETPTTSPFALGEEEPEPLEATPEELGGLPEEHDAEAEPAESLESPWPETTEEPEPTAEHGGPMPAEATETDEEVVIKELHLPRPAKLDLENRVRAGHAHRGERDAFYEKSWVRRQSDSIDDIHNYIDTIIGSDLDPRRRRQRVAATGYHDRPATDVSSVHVEGLDEDLTIAFTFPQREFRGAKVVYETEGGYVVEVTRAIGGNDDRTEVQYYTVSRVGSVGHVLDRLRNSDRAALHEGRATPAVKEALQEVDESTSAEPLPEEFAASEPGDEAASAAPPASPLGETRTEPAPTHPEGSPPSSPEAEYATTDPRPEDAVSGVTQETAPEVETAPVEPPEQSGTETSPARADTEDEEDTGGKRGFGLFGRKKKDDAEDQDTDEPVAAEDEEPSDAAGKKGRGLFGRRKKGEDEGDEADEAGEPDQ